MSKNSADDMILRRGNGKDLKNKNDDWLLLKMGISCGRNIKSYSESITTFIEAIYLLNENDHDLADRRFPQ